MIEFNSIGEVVENVKEKLDSSSDKKKLSILYAFNSTGKTRLSTAFSDLAEDQVLCYNAFIEDIFMWDNENFILTFDSNSWIANLINEQGLENNISDNFSKFINSKIEPSFDMKKGRITFNIPSGDDDSKTNIKISKGEESMFVWSIFFTILETAIDELNTEEDERSTDIFNDYKYVIVDDPVSSIDDTKLISMAINLINTLDLSKNKDLRFLITTHHALFYNVFFSTFNNRQKKKEYKFIAQILSKKGNCFNLKNQGDSPFGYHLVVKNTIDEAIKKEDIKKYHFNLFRTMLEKTANFLGYYNWDACIVVPKKQKITRLINLFSHSKLSDLENKDLSDEHKNLFKEAFESFVKEFKWNVKE